MVGGGEEVQYYGVILAIPLTLYLFLWRLRRFRSQIGGDYAILDRLRCAGITRQEQV
jgi:hypothetical protein